MHILASKICIAGPSTNLQTVHPEGVGIRRGRLNGRIVMYEFRGLIFGGGAY